ncbi:WbqC family protein [Streptosporangium oxazolinicum]|uniref:WbqC family protein n=1 Tax=Streptosporangium oxazolinicum TaxID=909287 RepID=A0ABP8B527_9ACTN
MNGTRVLVAHQPAYLPWPGYLSRLVGTETLVLLDHVQFSERGWQHRNFIRGVRGDRLRLTVPVRRRFGQSIREVRLADTVWAERHWRSIDQCYRKAAFWPRYGEGLRAIYAAGWERLVDVNQALLRFLFEAFGLRIRCVRSSDLAPEGTGTRMLADLARRTGKTVLRVGTGAARYLEPTVLADAGIAVQVATYETTGEQPLSALDLLMRHGPDARALLENRGRIHPLVTS